MTKKKYIFKEHADASFYGMGPWVIDSIHPSGWIKMVPADDGVAYSAYVTAGVMDFSESFVEAPRG